MCLSGSIHFRLENNRLKRRPVELDIDGLEEIALHVFAGEILGCHVWTRDEAEEVMPL